MVKALLVVDVQKDFVEGGSLAVDGGLAVAHGIHDLILNERGSYKKILASKDWHSREGDNGGHFHGDPDFVDTWPAHCVASSHGSEFAANLDGLLFDDVFHKGWNAPAYSAFEGISVRNGMTNLDEYLYFDQIDEVDVVGIASTHCVKATVLDGLQRSYRVNVIARLTVGVGGEGNHLAALHDMELAGAVIL